ncbi:MAG: hypothetical protein ACXWUN_07650 [Allosphingosinicella sp.]
MAETFWISFHISESGNADRRYQALISEIHRQTSDLWWTESVNFLLFHSEHSIDDIAAAVFRSFDPEVDLALLAIADAQEARAIGAIEDGMLFELLPYAQRYQPPPRPAPRAMSLRM